MNKKSHFVRCISLLLVFSLFVPCTAFAAVPEQVEPQASYYLDSYQTYVCPIGSGKIQVWFDVIGVGTQDEIGTLSIKIYESSDNQTWTWKKTFLHENYSNMLAYNTNRNVSYVTYQGTVGKYYRAYVCIWGGSDGNGDSRYVWTSSKLAVQTLSST